MEAGQSPGGGEVGDPAEREVPKPYVPTEEERRLLKECAEESARYRAFPLAAVSMLATSFLIRKGVLKDTSRFGSFTKVAFAGMCGYLAGKISYLPICSEKFKKLKDSPIGDVLRQAQRHSSHNRSSRKSEFSDMPPQSFTESSSPRAEFPLSSSYSDDYSSTDRALSSYEPVPFSASLNESSPTGITDYTAQDPAPIPEESRKKKGITYEELRNKHRETYEVMLPPKAGTPSKFSQEKPVKEGGSLGSGTQFSLRTLQGTRPASSTAPRLQTHIKPLVITCSCQPPLKAAPPTQVARRAAGATGEQGGAPSAH